jgi:pSer/pThr/pTyr-binding forkhead associated (FHA) protein
MKRARESLGYLTFLPEESFDCGTIPPVMKLKKGRIVIGRGSPTVPVDIVLSIKVDDKEIISRAHAEIVGDNEGRYFIRDLGSINGVFVNGCKADRHQLKEGDVVQVKCVQLINYCNTP